MEEQSKEPASLVSHESQLQEYSPSSQQPSDKSASAVYQESPPQPLISPHTETRDEVLHSEAVELSRCIIDSMVSVIVSVSAVAEQRHYPNIEDNVKSSVQSEPDTAHLEQDILTEQDTTQPEQDTTEYKQDTTHPEQDIVKLEQDTMQDTTQQLKQDTTQPEQDTIKHTTQPEQDTTLLEQDTTHHEQDTTQPEQDTTLLEQDTTHPEQDTVKLEQDTIQPEEQGTMQIQHPIPEQEMADDEQDTTLAAMMKPAQQQLHVTNPVNLSCYTVEGKEQYLFRADSDDEIQVCDISESESKSEFIVGDTNETGVHGMSTTEHSTKAAGASIATAVETILECTKSISEAGKMPEDDVMDPPPPAAKRQKLSCEIDVETSTLMSDKAVQTCPDGDLTDDGCATLLQALPSECAREHALILRIPSCHTQESQFDGSNDGDDPPDGNGGWLSSQVAEGATWPLGPDHTPPPPPPLALRTLHSLDNDMSPDYTTLCSEFENQLVPEDTLQQHYCTSQSFYTETTQKTPNQLKTNPSPTYLVPMAVNAIPPEDNEMVDLQVKQVTSCPPPSQPSSIITAFPTCFKDPADMQTLQAATPGLVNFNKPRLRLGLSKRQKCRSLHDN